MTQDIQPELTILREAKARGRGATLGALVKLSGPGWMQSAVTLGGGSLSGALFLGVIGGTSMLWVQLVAMALGVIMLCAISYVTLSTGNSPFQSMRTHINPALAWGWLIATMLANVIWALPQFSLAYSAISQNLFPELFAGADNGVKFLVSLVILALVTGITLCYGTEGRGIKIYETILKIVVASIVLCFAAVVIKISQTAPDFSWSEISKGFIPDFGALFNPSDKYQSALDRMLVPEVKQYWASQVIDYQRSTMIAATATAVGINMTFLLPYSLLNKGWNKEFRGLVIADLSIGMVIPFVLAVSCVTIASAHMFHGKTYSGLLNCQDIISCEDARLAPAAASVLEKNKLNQQGLNSEQYSLTLKEQNLLTAAMSYQSSLYDKTGRAGTIAPTTTPIGSAEVQLAAMLVKRDTGAFAESLIKLTGDRTVANTLFGLGVLAMAFSSISLLMLISGYAVCEMLGATHGGKIHKIGSMLPALGTLWPIIWGQNSGAFLAIVTSTIGYILFPIACLGFFLMMNSPQLLKDQMPRGLSRIVWNLAMGVSLLTTGVAAGWTAWNKTLGDFPIGIVGLAGFIGLVIMGHFYKKKQLLNTGDGNCNTPVSR